MVQPCIKSPSMNSRTITRSMNGWHQHRWTTYKLCIWMMYHFNLKLSCYWRIGPCLDWKSSIWVTTLSGMSISLNGSLKIICLNYQGYIYVHTISSRIQYYHWSHPKAHSQSALPTRTTHHRPQSNTLHPSNSPI